MGQLTIAPRWVSKIVNKSCISSSKTILFWHVDCFFLGRIDATPSVARLTVSNDGKLYAWDKEGKVMAGWPKDFSAENRFFSFRPRLVDTDYDLQEEVIAVSEEKGSNNLRLHVFKGSGQELETWRFDLPIADLLETPILADVNHDSSFDIIYATKAGHVYVYRRDFQPSSPP